MTNRYIPQNKNDHFDILNNNYPNGDAVPYVKATIRNIIVENYREIRRETIYGKPACYSKFIHDTLHYKSTLHMCMLIDEQHHKL